MRVRVSEVDQMAYYQRSEDMPVEELVARLRREEAPSRRMDAGTAWHAILEDPPDEIDVIERDGFVFRFAADAQIALGQVREIRASRVFRLHGHDVELSGGCDVITGGVVEDHKLTARPDVERYADAFQWRAYLVLFDAHEFRYRIWPAKDDGQQIVVGAPQTFPLYRYPGMERDVERKLAEFVEFAVEYLPERCDDAIPGLDDLGDAREAV